VSELIGYAQFLDRREQRRTADRGRGFPGATAPAPNSIGGRTAIECEPPGPSPHEARTDRAVALAEVTTPTRGPVPRWRARPLPPRP
jgi:hypothetical protein